MRDNSNSFIVPKGNIRATGSKARYRHGRKLNIYKLCST